MNALNNKEMNGIVGEYVSGMMNEFTSRKMT